MGYESSKILKVLLSISSNMEDNGANNDLNCRGLSQEVSEENINICPRDHSCDILVKTVLFLPFSKVSEAKVKNFGLISLAEEISR